MSRKALAVLVGVLGFVIAGATLVGMLVMGSLFADARTDKITGPGVDVFLRTPFPEERSTIVIDVEARGGSRAGINQVTVSDGEQTVATETGTGASWGSTIHSGKSRGSESVTVRFEATKPAGQTLPLAIQVSYVVAMTSGGSFDNEHHDDIVKLDVPVYSDSGRHKAQLKQVGFAVGCFAIWFLIVWGVAALYARAGDGASSESEGMGILMGIMGGGVMGYWLFAWRIMNVLETQATIWAVILTTAWVVAPLVWAWRWSKRRPKQRRASIPTAVALPRQGIGHDPALPSALILETSKLRLADLVDGAPALVTVTNWVDEMLASPELTRSATLRRRVVALNWVLVTVGPTLHKTPADDAARARRDGLVRAIQDATEISDDAERAQLAARVLELVN